MIIQITNYPFSPIFALWLDLLVDRLRIEPRMITQNLVKGYTEKRTIADTPDIDVFRQVAAKHFTGVKNYHFKDIKNFRFKIGGFEVGSIGLYCTEYSTGTTVTPDEMKDIMIAISDGDHSQFSIDNDPVVCKKGVAAVLTPKRNISIERLPSSQLLHLCVPTDTLQRKFEDNTRSAAPLSFRYPKSISTDKSHWGRIIRLVGFLWNSPLPEPGLGGREAFAANVEDLIIDYILHLSNDYSEAMVPHKDSVAQRILHTAEEYIEAHYMEAITISDMVIVCACSRSSLFDIFRKYRCYTPLQFLSSRRMLHARRKLLNPEQGDSVTTIAYSNGIGHLGRFSGEYRRVYGESPFNTLSK